MNLGLGNRINDDSRKGAKDAKRIAVVSIVYMAPIIISFTLVGSFVPRGYEFDMYLALAFGVIGYIARKTGYHVAAILIGVILGPLLEQYFQRALRIAEGDLMVIFSSKLGNVMWVFMFISLGFPFVMDWWRRRQKERQAENA